MSSTKNSFGSSVDTNDVRAALDNLLRLEIYYKEFNYEGIQETPAYTVQCGSFCSLLLKCTNTIVVTTNRRIVTNRHWCFKFSV